MEAVAQLGRVVISLAFVLLLMWGLARFIKRSPRTRDGKLLDVLARTQLSRNSSIAVVRVLDQALIVGITDGQVSLIGETDLAAAEQQLEQNAPARKRGAAASAVSSAPASSSAGAASSASPRSAARTSSHRTARPAASTASNTAQVNIPADIPGADLLAKASGHGTPTTAAKQGSVGGPKTAQEAKSSPLSGSALSPATWRQTVESLRDLTVRTR